MIVRTEATDLVLVTQVDHAHFAAEVMRLWREPELEAHPRRQALLRAIRLHDNGWREADAAPRIDPETGAPLAFTGIPDPLREEIWRRGILRYREQDPYVALLILRHARALHPDPPEPVAALLAELGEEAEAWREEAAVTEAAVDSDYRWLAVGDALSLMVANRWSERQLRDRRASMDGDELRLDPFPLAGSTRFALPVRHIPRRHYESDRDLAVTLATARWQRETVRITPEVR